MLKNFGTFIFWFPEERCWSIFSILCKLQGAKIARVKLLNSFIHSDSSHYVLCKIDALLMNSQNFCSTFPLFVIFVIFIFHKVTILKNLIFQIFINLFIQNSNTKHEWFHGREIFQKFYLVFITPTYSIEDSIDHDQQLNRKINWKLKQISKSNHAERNKHFLILLQSK